MIVNKVDAVRMLHLVQSVGQTEVVIREDGSFGVTGIEGSSMLIGKGVSFGTEVGLLDISQVLKILDTFTPLEVNVVVDKGFLVFTGGDIKYSCRLADVTLIDSLSPEQLTAEQQAGWVWTTGVLTIEEILRIKKLIKSLGLGTVEFKSVNGVLNVVVGDKNYFYGELNMNTVQFEGHMAFETANLEPVLSALDDAKVTLNFGLRAKTDPNTQQTYKEGVLCISTQDCTWLIGSLQGQ